MKILAPFLFLFFLVSLACSPQPPAANSAVQSSASPTIAANDSSKNTAPPKFHVTGALLNKDRTPAADQKVIMEEITGEKDNRKTTITFGIENGTTKLNNPSAMTDASGHFDIEIDTANVGKEYGLTVWNLKSPATGPSRKSPYLTVNGKRVTFKVQGEPGELKLGEIIMK
jgi:hypothetical protein